MAPVPAPFRNADVVGAQVLAHSGEYAPTVVDLQLPARGVHPAFVRHYRSGRAGQDGLLGRGWVLDYDRRLELDGEGMRYADGSGAVHHFSPSAEGWASPDGLYARLEAGVNGFELRQPGGAALAFADPLSGGRLLAIRDRNGNALTFHWAEDALVVTDPFGRSVRVALEGGRVSEVDDGRRR